MTLLELLRQELPKHGGWPEGTNFIAQDSYDSASPGKIYAYENKPEQCETYWVNRDDSDGYGNFVMKSEIIAEDSTTAIVTREQYEVASWNGTDLPPVGVECEMQNNNGQWINVCIIAQFDGFSFGWNYDCRMVYFSDKPTEFRPLRTEVERAIDEMVQLSGVSTGAAKILYDAGYRK